MRYAPFDWYQTPVYYDVVFDPLADEESAFVNAAFERHARVRGRRRRVLEPACGSGRVLEGLIARGWAATGFDLSAGMVARAKARLPAARISKQSMQRFVVRGDFELVYNLVSTFKYLRNDEEALSHLARVADVLRPGGLFLLGLHLADYEQQGCTRERWVGERGGTTVVCNVQRWPPQRRKRTERARARLVVTEQGRTRGFESVWQFRTYSERQLMRLVARERRLSHIATYGFDFDVDRPVADPDRLDRVLVLIKRD